MAYQSIYTGAQIDEAVGAAVNIGSFSATLPASGWVGDEAPYTQTVSVAGITGADRPVVDVVQSDDAEIAQTEIEAWGMVSKIETGAESITATCYSDKPEVDLNLNIVRVV